MKVLIIGLGSIAQKHIKAIKNIDADAEITALRTSGNQETRGVRNIYSINDIPADIDFIIISNPTGQHAKTIKDVVHLNKPVFIEKPLLHSLDEAGELKIQLEENKTVTYVGCNLRFHPLLKYLKEHLDTQTINEVNVYCGSYLPDWRKGKDFKTLYSADPSNGGGVHLDLIHEIDYVFWLFGKPSEVKHIWRNVSGLGIASVDYASYCLLYKNFTVNIVLNYYRKDSKRDVEIVMESGTWHGDLIAGTLKNVTTGLEIFQTEKNISNTYQAQMEYFIACLAGRKKPMNDFTEGIEVLKICLNEL